MPASSDDPEAASRAPDRGTPATPLGQTPRTRLRIQAEDFYQLKPDESVYSFHLFMPPVEEKRTGSRWTWLMVFSIGLVFLNFLMQYGLLYVVGRFVNHEHHLWIDSVIRLDTFPFYHLHRWPSYFAEEEEQCRTTETLCQAHEDGWSCAPPSIKLLNNWSALDVNGDGVWSRWEAEDEGHRAAMLCKYGTDIVVLFDDVVDALVVHPLLRGRLHSNLTAGLQVHRPYIDWYIGEPTLCMYRDEDMCGNLFEKGVFTMAIEERDSGESQIKDLDSAKHFCREMLSHKCERLLPSTYHVWKISAAAKCGAKEFEDITYDSPDGDENKWMVKVDFEKRIEHKVSQEWSFFVFLSILLIIFFLTMLDEWKGIFRVFLWSYQYEDLLDTETQFVPDHFHRNVVLVINTSRFILFCVVLYTGTMFLTSDTNYLGLIFDALSLVFIIQIDELLYKSVLRGPMKEEHQDLDRLWLRRHRLPISATAAESLLFLSVLGMAMLVASSYIRFELEPLREALDCVCLAEGPRCLEATKYSETWWDEYWLRTLPTANMKINRLVGMEA